MGSDLETATVPVFNDGPSEMKVLSAFCACFLNFFIYVSSFLSYPFPSISSESNLRGKELEIVLIIAIWMVSYTL